MSPVDDGSRLFPGPRPYDEKSAHLFFGREREVERMLIATFERLGVLSAETGAGKSSILAAGYIPELRWQRASGRPVPPVLLVRDWGGGPTVSADYRLLMGAHAAVRDLEQRQKEWAALARVASDADPRLVARSQRIADSLARDSACLGALLPAAAATASGGLPVDVKAGWDRLCDGANGLIVILDQFEEFMGTASQSRAPMLAEHAVNAVGRLYREHPRVRILIALRAEYCRTLQRYLNRFVTNLDRRIIDLPPLPAQSIQAVIQGAAQRAGQQLEADVARAFAETVAAASRPKAAEILAAGAGAPGTALDDLGSAESSFSLLEVQAILRGYEQQAAGGVLSVSIATLDAYMDDLAGAHPPPPRPAGDGIQARSGVGDLGAEALRRWVHEQLDDAAGKRCLGRGANPNAGLIRWMLAPLLPRLATQGGYKQHLPLLDLLLDLAKRLAPGSETARGAPLASAVRAWMEGGMDGRPALGEGVHEHGDLSHVGRLLADSRPGPRVRCLVEECLHLLHETIVRLETGGILKLSGEGETRSCELVHDGLADHVGSWARLLATEPAATLGSPVTLRGERFHWIRLSPPKGEDVLVVEGVEWVGASLLGATIRNVRFEKCNLRGTFLGGCRLEGVTFEGCDLSASVFQGALGGKAAEGKDLDRVEFRHSRLRSTAFINCAFGDRVRFVGELPDVRGASKPAKGLRGPSPAQPHRRIRSDMTCVSFEGCHVPRGSHLEFLQCIVRFALIGRFNLRDGDDVLRLAFKDCDLMNAWIWDAGLPTVQVDGGCRTIGLLSFDLPPAARLDRLDAALEGGDEW